MAYRIVCAVDGSESAARAVAWCAEHGKQLDAEVIAVHALDFPPFAVSSLSYMPIPPVSDTARDEILDLVRREWCAPLEKEGVPFVAELHDGSPADVVIQVADEKNAELVVTGRRGRGGFRELLLGSTSHQLAHHLKRPLLIVP
jgi:nucleotide-binding universal stress UspA family protein